MPFRTTASWGTSNPNAVRSCMCDTLQTFPSVYGDDQDNFKPGEGSLNEEYSRFNYNTHVPNTESYMREYYGDTHVFKKSINSQRYYPGCRN